MGAKRGYAGRARTREKKILAVEKVFAHRKTGGEKAATEEEAE